MGAQGFAQAVWQAAYARPDPAAKHAMCAALQCKVALCCMSPARPTSGTSGGGPRMRMPGTPDSSSYSWWASPSSYSCTASMPSYRPGAGRVRQPEGQGRPAEK